MLWQFWAGEIVRYNHRQGILHRCIFLFFFPGYTHKCTKLPIFLQRHKIIFTASRSSQIPRCNRFLWIIFINEICTHHFGQISSYKNVIIGLNTSNYMDLSGECLLPSFSNQRHVGRACLMIKLNLVVAWWSWSLCVWGGGVFTGSLRQNHVYVYCVSSQGPAHLLLSLLPDPRWSTDSACAAHARVQVLTHSCSQLNE